MGQVNVKAFIILLLLSSAPYVVLPIPVSSATPTAQGTQTPAEPLPPGTVSYTNTWNLSQTPACVYPSVQKQALAPRNASSISIVIPAVVFIGKASGTFIDQTYEFYSNGGFVATDDSGNSFSFGPLAGLPQGTTTSLHANSTAAFQNYFAETGGSVTANVTVSYVIRHQSCQPAGLTITINGEVNWGSSITGTISLSFKSPPISVASDRALFGNTSDIQIGFDWSDSVNLNPTFSAVSRSISCDRRP